jgi:hypothetical protein
LKIFRSVCIPVSIVKSISHPAARGYTGSAIS